MALRHLFQAARRPVISQGMLPQGVTMCDFDADCEAHGNDCTCCCAQRGNN